MTPDYSVGTMNIPFTYPPEGLDGFQISGMDTPSETSPFIHPPELLRRELVESSGQDPTLISGSSAQCRPTNGATKCSPRWNRSTSSGPRLRSILLENHPQDVMMFVFMSIDTVQHYFWQHMDHRIISFTIQS